MNNNYAKLEKIINEHASLLGARGVKRLLELASIDKNWDGDDSSSMNEQSLNDLMNFIKEIKKPLPDDIGYFFDFNGYLIINWEAYNEITDITFNPEAIYLYSQGFDDGIVIPQCVWKDFDYKDPTNAIKPYQEKLEIASPVLERFNKETAESLINSITREFGWGEHGDELEVKVESLISLVLFIKQLEVIPESIYFYSNCQGDIEAFWTSDHLRHELEAIEDGIELFEAPEYDYTKVLREDFNKHKLLTEFLKENHHE